jgi:two-component system, NarL family, nitrate/nitrite response regulator NarL
MAQAGRPIRVLVADDHPLYLEGLARAVERAEDLELVGTCRDGADALRRIRDTAPDVAVLDLRMPRLTAREILEELAATDAATAVLILSAHTGGDEVHECLSLGAAGYIAKDSERGEVCEAIRRVAGGRPILSIDVQASVSAELRKRHDRGHALLSPRETEVLGMLAQGTTANEIARTLHLTTATVKTHLHRLYEKLGVSDRGAAVAEGMRRGLIR